MTSSVLGNLIAPCSWARERKTAEKILGAVGRVQQRTKNQKDNLSITRVPEMTDFGSGMFPVEFYWDTKLHVDCTLTQIRHGYFSILSHFCATNKITRR